MKNSMFLGFSCVLVALSVGSAQPAWSIDVQVAEAPANDLALTVSAIQSAQKSLLLNIYELSSPDVADALLNRIQAGVQVRILEEGQPVGGMSAASKGIVSQLVQAMQSAGSSDVLFEMSSKAGGKRRFRYDHAKYAVIDGTSLLVGSENYSPTGNPQPGTVGNRGWEVFIQDSALAAQFTQIFQSDTDTSHGDLINMMSGGVAYALDLSDQIQGKKPKPLPAPVPPITNPAPVVPFPVSGAQSLTASAVDSFTAPDTSLSGLTAMLRAATTSIDIEQMTFDPAWGPKTNPGDDPLLVEVLAAARRGVKVRVLLNDETVFDTAGKTAKPKNPVTIAQLNQAASSEGLQIQAVVANVKAMGVDYIHNKGAVIDGNKTLISSINWDENAVEKNREAAVLITSPEIFQHYEALFQHDWDVSNGSASEDFSARKVPTIDPSNCPDSVSLGIKIGDIKISDAEDKSFQSLSDQSFNLTMSRDKTNKGCIFMSTERTSMRKVFEIRPSADGGILYVFEGYTTNGKLYSIRTRTDSMTDTTLDSVVYDGHERLGDAVMSIQSQ